MSGLLEALEYSFENLNIGWRNRNSREKRDKTVYMEIPITGDIFEVPAFALHAFQSKDMFFDKDLIVARLECIGVKSNYKSLAVSIRDTIESSFKNNSLAKIATVGDPQRTYYGTQGAIFDENYNPVMLATWEIKKVHSKECAQSFQYMFTRPILRVVPEVVINKYNTVERYIVNKIIPTALSLNYITTPVMRNTSNIFLPTYYGNSSKVKIIIDKFPFSLKEPDTPSISTTNSSLLHVAMEHIDELVQ